MYQALYLKYRPKSFDDVIGQEHITTTLKNEIVNSKTAHAYLFVGSRGTGKTTCARILTKALNCLNPVGGEPCGECEICKSIDEESATDVVEIDAASNNGVDNIRELRDEINYLPAAAKYRVYIIDEVHMLSKGAFNAFLKTLEEPPEHVKFILATTEINKVPETILSRCQRFDFKRISQSDIAKRIQFVARSEGGSVTNGAAMTLASLADGAMRNALSLLESCMMRSTDVTEQVVQSVCGLIGKEYLEKTVEGIYNKDTAQLLTTVGEVYASSCDMASYCLELINYFRNIMVARTVKEADELLMCSPEEAERIKKWSKLFTLPACIAVITAFQSTYAEISSGAERRTAVETTLVKISSPETDTRDESILKRLAEIENRLQNGEFIVPATPEPPSEVKKVPPKTPVIAENNAEKPEEAAEEVKEEVLPDSSPQPQEAESAAKDFNGWRAVINEVSKTSPYVWAMLTESRAKAVGDTIVVSGENPALRETLAIKENADSILAAAEKLGKSFKKVVCEDGGGSTSVFENRHDALNGLIDKAIENDIKINLK